MEEDLYLENIKGKLVIYFISKTNTLQLKRYHVHRFCLLIFPNVLPADVNHETFSFQLDSEAPLPIKQW